MPNLFEGQRVRLRAVEASDWQVFYLWDFDTDFGRLTDKVWFPGSSDSVRAWAEKQSRQDAKNDKFRFVIETLNREMVGTINTHHCVPRNGTFMYGIAIAPPHRCRGYASEAIRLTLRYFFDERRCQKVNAEVYSFNSPSIQLHERLGFRLEGRLRRMIYTGGQYHDVLIYGLTREEFEF